MSDNAPNFIENIAKNDLDSGKHQKIITRFPPEPNGYLHVGHAKSICVNFGLAERLGGECNLRFDDTNPAKEDQEYVDAIKSDVQWLGFKWAGDVKYASSYFDQFYEWALYLIKEGKAYVCDLTADQSEEYKGNFTTPGKNSPFRDRTVEENLQLIEKMRNGEFAEGSCVLRAKIDMQSANMNLRDPIMYRIRHVEHHQTGNKWCIYPNYDFAHGQEDAIEGVTHSVCTLEFSENRPLYEWFTQNLPVPAKPTQYEFGRLNLNYTVTSKRKLKQLVDENVVEGWNDPRMPTISGMRRRGYSATGIRNFCDSLAVSRSDGIVDMAQLEFFVREDLNDVAPRAMCVLDPVELVITNFAEFIEGDMQVMNAPAHPNNEALGQRELPFTPTLLIDRADFTEDTTLSRKKFKRLVLGEFVRLRAAYVIKAEEVIKDAQGEIIQIKATLVPGTVGENPPEGMKPRGVIHWVSATQSKKAQVRVYDRLFNVPSPGKESGDFLLDVNADSLVVLEDCWVEPSVALAATETVFQFEREGYFCVDSSSTADDLIINKTIGLKDTWSGKDKK
jgi:glutaminyl-tRNA synthetase